MDMEFLNGYNLELWHSVDFILNTKISHECHLLNDEVPSNLSVVVQAYFI